MNDLNHIIEEKECYVNEQLVRIQYVTKDALGSAF